MFGILHSDHCSNNHCSLVVELETENLKTSTLQDESPCSTSIDCGLLFLSRNSVRMQIPFLNNGFKVKQNSDKNTSSFNCC